MRRVVAAVVVGLLVTLAWETQMAIGAPMTVDQQLAALFADGTSLRTRIVDGLGIARAIAVTPKEAVLRARISDAEKLAGELTRDFIAYDARVTTFIQTLATVQVVNGATVNLNNQLQFAIFSS